jgi:hypothetical protein
MRTCDAVGKKKVSKGGNQALTALKETTEDIGLTNDRLQYHFSKAPRNQFGLDIIPWKSMRIHMATQRPTQI